MLNRLRSAFVRTGAGGGGRSPTKKTKSSPHKKNKSPSSNRKRRSIRPLAERVERFGLISSPTSSSTTFSSTSSMRSSSSSPKRRMSSPTVSRSPSVFRSPPIPQTFGTPTRSVSSSPSPIFGTPKKSISSPEMFSTPRMEEDDFILPPNSPRFPPSIASTAPTLLLQDRRVGRTRSPTSSMMLERTRSLSASRSSSSSGSKFSRGSSSKFKSYAKRKNSSALRLWFKGVFNPTSDYFYETLIEAGFDISDTELIQQFNTLPKVKKALKEAVEKTSAGIVVDMVRRDLRRPDENLFNMLTPEEFKKIYVTFEKKRISNIGKDGVKNKTPWSFYLKRSSPIFKKIIKDGKICTKGKAINPVTKRCKNMSPVLAKAKRSPKRK